MPGGHEAVEQLLRHHATHGDAEQCEAAVRAPGAIQHRLGVSCQQGGGLAAYRVAAAAADAAGLIQQDLLGPERRVAYGYKLGENDSQIPERGSP